MVICMPKIYFIFHFFFDMLNFKESDNLTGQQYFGPQLENPNFTKYWIGRENQ